MEESRGRHAAPPIAARRIDDRHNSLNAVRLVLAVTVIVSHAPKALGGDALSFGDLEIGGWAVAGFFGISGWLVTQSRLRLPFADYLWRRCLRIYPGFWACLAVTAFVLAPLAALAGPGSWRPVAAVRYVVDNLTMAVVTPRIPTTLRGAPLPGTWNLSLWTLAYEFLCYLGIGLLFFLPVARRRASVVVGAFVLVTVAHAALLAIGEANGSFLVQGARLGSCFLAGAVLQRCTSIPLTAPIAAAMVVVLAGLTATGGLRVLGALPIAYVCLWLGSVLPLQRIGRRNDVSYGVYVYGFPIQQLLAVAGILTSNTVLYVLATLALVIPLAWLSWRLVEQPALRLKKAPPFFLTRFRPDRAPAPAAALR